jgi:hypothetical protein
MLQILQVSADGVKTQMCLKGLASGGMGNNTPGWLEEEDEYVFEPC